MSIQDTTGMSLRAWEFTAVPSHVPAVNPEGIRRCHLNACCPRRTMTLRGQGDLVAHCSPKTATPFESNEYANRYNGRQDNARDREKIRCARARAGASSRSAAGYQ